MYSRTAVLHRVDRAPEQSAGSDVLDGGVSWACHPSDGSLTTGRAERRALPPLFFSHSNGKLSLNPWKHTFKSRLAKPRLSLLVYSLGMGLFHSAVLIDGMNEYHFFEGTGLQRLKRVDEALPALAGLPLVQEIEFRSVGRSRAETLEWLTLAARNGFASHDYNILRNNCNSFT